MYKHTCHLYMCALGYTDDITLTCLSLYGLNYMLDISNHFEYSCNC